MLVMGSIRADAQTGFIIRQATNGVFTLGAEKLLMDAFGETAFRINPTISSDGQISISADPNTNGITLGMVQLIPQSNATDKQTRVDWNVLTGAFSFRMPPGLIRSTSGFWPEDEGRETKEFLFDSTADFEFKLELPKSDFANIETAGGSGRNHFFIFERKNGVLGLRIRDRQQLVIGGDGPGVERRRGSSVTGSLSRTLEIEDVAEFGTLSMSYNSDEEDFQFQTRASAFGINGAFKFGTEGGAFCHTLCGLGEPLEDCDESFCIK